MVNLEEIFNQSVEEWIEHCKNDSVKFSSSTQPLRDCDSYRTIVSLGHGALPLIRALYDKEGFNTLELSIVKGRGLPQIVGDIVGEDFKIPREIVGKTKAMEDYTKKWLDENMQKYIGRKT